MNEKFLVKKFGCNTVVNNISEKNFEKKICKLTDNFYSNFHNKLIRYKMYFVKKK